jgi:hypothetical protein
MPLSVARTSSVLVGGSAMVAARRLMVAALVPASASAARKAATVAGVAGSGVAPRAAHQERKMAQSDA